MLSRQRPYGRLLTHSRNDAVNRGGVAQLGRLDGAGARAGAHVTDHGAGLDVELGQRDGAPLGLGDQPALGPALGEEVVGVAEAAEARRLAPPLGRARLVL